MIAMPYLFSAVLGYSDTIVNTVFLKSGLEAHGNTSEEIVLITGCINYGVLKLMSIPMILAPGFSSAIIPHITSALARQDYKQIRKNIDEGRRRTHCRQRLASTEPPHNNNIHSIEHQLQNTCQHQWEGK